MTSTNDKYQGRQTARKSSAERRIKILEATMRIIIREGIRNVRHRAVATEAEVPLAATTYYFEHINDLISDAFVLFCERQRERNHLLGDACYQLTVSYSRDATVKTEGRDALVQSLAEMILAHIEHLLANPDDVILERAFVAEAFHNPLLQDLVDSSVKEMQWLIEKSLREVDSAHSAIDARNVLAMIDHLEYTSVMAGQSNFNRHVVLKTLTRTFQLILHREASQIA